MNIFTSHCIRIVLNILLLYSTLAVLAYISNIAYHVKIILY